jgi:hypothetical protein
MTMVETTAALVIMMVITGSVVTAARLMVVGATGLEQESRIRETARLATMRMREELAAATTISELTSSSITFTHPDTDGDSLSEVIRYSWGGKEGDPLIREIRGIPRNIVDACSGFALAVDVQAPASAAIAGHGEEMLLAYHDFDATRTYSSYEYGLSQSNLIAHCFTPSMAGASRFRLTRVRAQIGAAGTTTNGEVVLSLTTTSSGNPTTTVIDSARLPVRNLGTPPEWHELVFAADTPLTVGTAYALVFAADRANAAVVPFDTLVTGSPTLDSHAKFSTDRGGAWNSGSPAMSSDVRILVYGKFNVATAASTVPAGSSVKSVYVEFTAIGTSRNATSRAGVLCVNQPPLTGVSLDADQIRNRN